MASVDVFDVETKEVSWNTRKGHRHLLLGSGKGRSSFSHSVSSKWLRRQQPRPETLTMELQGSSESKGRKQAMPRRYAEESEHCMVKSAREALEWQSHESCELWWWHFGDDSDDDDDDLDVEIAWKRQFTAGSSASTASSSASANASKAARWEKAQALAEDVAQKLRMTMPCVLPSAPSVEKEPEIPEVEEYEEVEGPISHASRFEVRPVGAGAPPANLLDLHDEVLKSAGRATSQAKKWRNRRYKINQPALYPCEEFVSPKSEEYDVVTRYFEATLGQRCSIQSLTRLPAPQEAASRRAFRTDGDHTVMFHGCRSEVNERNIVTNGFRVSSCLSGGRNFGTWFAYKADYSNIGYAFDDRKGWRHIFICVVSYYHTVLDNGTMRVVGQGCAYPQWLLRYKLQPLPCPTPAAAPAAAPMRPPAAVTRGNERTWYVVRNGKWELEKT